MSEKTKQQTKAEKRAAALRENLKKRKALTKAKTLADKEANDKDQ
tara:strand:+ start:1253 stop:1387 length:135 start_codon:yes stop_codon:yes gene_type:complete